MNGMLTGHKYHSLFQCAYQRQGLCQFIMNSATFFQTIYGNSLEVHQFMIGSQFLNFAWLVGMKVCHAESMLDSLWS